MIAAEGRYHRSCSVKFRANDSSASKTNQRGRQPNNDLQNSFSKTFEWLEMDTDLVTVKEFREKMVQFSENNDSYTTKHIKNILKEKYGAYVFFTDTMRESKNVICFQDMASYIISKRLNDEKGDTEDETESIIKAAADLIKSEIREMKYDSEYYPTCQDIVDRNWVPKSLMQFLSMFKLSDLRLESIGRMS